MDISIFLARFLGLYFIIVGTALLLRRKELPELLHQTLKSPALLLLSGVLALVAGLLITVAHNIWVFDWRVVITLFGYLAIFQGVARLFAPEWVRNFGSKLTQSDYFAGVLGILILIGLFLTYHGFV